MSRASRRAKAESEFEHLEVEIEAVFHSAMDIDSVDFAE